MIFDDTEVSALLKPLSERNLCESVQTMSRNFTRARAKIDEYTQSEDDVSAYTWFYMPTNKFKLGFLFDQLDSENIEEIAGGPFIDFGCGPGTYSWAFVEYCKYHSIEPSELVLIDRSSIMLKQARKLHATCYPEIPVVNFFRSPPTESIANSTLFFGNSINEIGLADTLTVIKKLNPKRIIYIEPGTKETFSIILRLRSALAELGFKVRYPCLSGSPCPLEETASDNWCHQIVLADYPESLKRKCQITALDRRSLPMTAGFFTKQQKANSESINPGRLIDIIQSNDLTQNQDTNIQRSCARIFRYLGEHKSCIRFEVCMQNSTQDLAIKKLEVMKRNLKKAEIKDLKTVTPGSKVFFVIEKVLEDGGMRTSTLEL